MEKSEYEIARHIHNAQSDLNCAIRLAVEASLKVEIVAPPAGTFFDTLEALRPDPINVKVYKAL